MQVKVTLLATCLVDMFHSQIGKATVELLERLGCEVDLPESQICCGQPAYHSGYMKEAKKAMEHMIETFMDAQYIVAPSGSCTYMLKQFKDIFKDDLDFWQKAEHVSEKTYELTDFIVNVLKVNDVGARLDGKATYHTSCHMTRLMGVRDEPYILLKNVKGLELQMLQHHEQCCGFGGTFSIKMGKIAEQIVDEKVAHILETGANYLIGADAGCLMNIGGRMQRKKIPIKVMHIAEVLNHV